MKSIKALPALLLLVATGANAATFKYGDYDDTALTCAITAYNGDDTKTLTIPDTHRLGGVTYQVTAINDSVFVGLKSVTKVVIGPNLTSIGSSLDGYSQTNFLRFPNLVRFEVSSANTAFASTKAGILVSKSGEDVYRVPSKIETSTGILKLSDNATHIHDGAFSGVTTISHLKLGKNMLQIFSNGGINESSLEKISVDDASWEFAVTTDGLLIGERTWWVEDGSGPYAYVVALPPKSGTKSITIPSTFTIRGTTYTVDNIGELAFANHQTIARVTIPNTVTQIKARAFKGSAVNSITIPASVNELLEEEMFMNCPRLTDLTIKSTKAQFLDSNFARDCPALRSVKADVPFSLIKKAAFKNCPTLEVFPFCGETILHGDSIFANTGFKKVIFDDASMRVNLIDQRGTFADCRNLQLIDMSAMKLTYIYPNEFYFCEGFAANCPKLETLIAPLRSRFHPEAFGKSCRLTKIVTNNFKPVDGNGAFNYAAIASPSLYAVTRDTWPAIQNPIAGLFHADNGVSIYPTVYCDAYSMATNADGEPNEYYIHGARYYVPGGTAKNYGDVAAASLHESYSLQVSSLERNGGTRFECHPLVQGIVLDDIEFGDKTVKFSADGIAETDIHHLQLPDVKINYTVNGVKMATTYPAGAFSDVTASAAISFPDQPTLSVDGRQVTFSKATDYTVIDMHGSVVASGHGSEADLSTFPAGVYVVNLPRATHKILLH